MSYSRHETIIPDSLIHKWARIIGPSAFLVWVYLNSRPEDNPTPQPVKNWAAKLGLSESTGHSALKILQKHDLITVIPPKGQDRLKHKPAEIIVEIPG